MLRLPRSLQGRLLVLVLGMVLAGLDRHRGDDLVRRAATNWTNCSTATWRRRPRCWWCSRRPRSTTTTASMRRSCTATRPRWRSRCSTRASSCCARPTRRPGRWSSTASAFESGFRDRGDRRHRVARVRDARRRARRAGLRRRTGELARVDPVGRAAQHAVADAGGACRCWRWRPGGRCRAASPRCAGSGARWRERPAQALQPVQLDDAPSEMEPMIDALNGLFERIARAAGIRTPLHRRCRSRTAHADRGDPCAGAGGAGRDRRRAAPACAASHAARLRPRGAAGRAAADPVAGGGRCGTGQPARRPGARSRDAPSPMSRPPPLPGSRRSNSMPHAGLRRTRRPDPAGSAGAQPGRQRGALQPGRGAGARARGAAKQARSC